MENKLTFTPRRRALAAVGLALAALGLGVLGIYIGETDDAPGAALGGLVLMLALAALSVKVARRRH